MKEWVSNGDGKPHHMGASKLEATHWVEVANMTKTKTQTKQTQSTNNARLRHYVELDAKGNSTDKALCGYEWDQLHVPHNGTICEECIEELRKRGQA